VFLLLDQMAVLVVVVLAAPEPPLQHQLVMDGLVALVIHGHIPAQLMVAVAVVVEHLLLKV
jgi:hypothetical protein